MTGAEIRKCGRRGLAAKYPMSQVSRAYEKGETQGFIKICADAETKQEFWVLRSWGRRR
jgi:pyruvate/2-oxoglutarate dehydrogenase complex dihydrolipoamide dehydrogenase (E3) component